MVYLSQSWFSSYFFWPTSNFVQIGLENIFVLNINNAIVSKSYLRIDAGTKIVYESYDHQRPDYAFLWNAVVIATGESILYTKNMILQYLKYSWIQCNMRSPMSVFSYLSSSRWRGTTSNALEKSITIASILLPDLLYLQVLDTAFSWHKYSDNRSICLRTTDVKLTSCSF